LPKLKPEELESRRNEIIEAARRCFLRHGFHQTTTDEICREAAITPGGLYHYFSSKEEIIVAVIQRSARNTAEGMRALIEQSDSAQTAFRGIGAMFFQAMTDPDVDNITRLEMEIWNESLRNEKLAEISKSGWALRRRMLAALIEKGIEDGMYESEDVEAKGLADLFASIMIGMRVAKLLWKDDYDVLAATRAMFLLHSGRLIANLPDLPDNLFPEGAKKTAAKPPAKLTPKTAARQVAEPRRVARAAGARAR
jgi:AcrR family transcriptional regulator